MKRCLLVLLAMGACALAAPAPVAAQAQPQAPAAATPTPAAPAPTPTPVPPSAAVVAPAPTGSFFWMPRGNRWLACTLSMGVSGLGQLYNGENEKGFGMMAATLGFLVPLGFDELTGRGYARTFYYVVLLGVKGWSMTDAFQNAVPAPLPTATPH